MERNLPQALRLLNGNTTQQRIRQRILEETLPKDKKSPADVITSPIQQMRAVPASRETRKAFLGIRAAPGLPRGCLFRRQRT